MSDSQRASARRDFAELGKILDSIKHSFDREFENRSPPRSAFTFLMKIEEIRYKYRALFSGSAAIPMRLIFIKKLRDDFQSASRHILDKYKDLTIIPLEKVRPHTSLPTPSIWARTPRDGMSLEVAIRNFDFIVSRHITDINDSDLKSLAIELNRNAPPQILAPVQFEIFDEKLRIARTPNASPLLSTENIAALRQHIISKHSELLMLLLNSNMDRKIVSQFEVLGNAINKENNIIIVGLENITTMSYLAACDTDELSSIQTATIFNHLEQISMYISQFSEWSQFQSNY
ncbi:hypothetical protein [Roseococcus suduntuyensis]|uniref:Uncharacterized protein n=1 Tax=Roseococcus suduntuyensis TaxID=455361 RepID=A0A840ADU0_9PROT|nr:hypothetical protein [Roseococcus suduntuyensis]MBB3898255.1 hypothetical protein [Roseococcus suduntuyensis]